jgi:hypothetical protein
MVTRETGLHPAWITEVCGGVGVGNLALIPC